MSPSCPNLLTAIIPPFETDNVFAYAVSNPIIKAELGAFAGIVTSFSIVGFFMSVMYPVIFSLALSSVSEDHGSFA